MFIPNESVYAFIHEQDPELLDVALQQKAVLCSPSTLFAVLAVIRQAMDNFMVDQTSEQILRCLGAFTDQWDEPGRGDREGRSSAGAHAGGVRRS